MWPAAATGCRVAVKCEGALCVAEGLILDSRAVVFPAAEEVVGRVGADDGLVVAEAGDDGLVVVVGVDAIAAGDFTGDKTKCAAITATTTTTGPATYHFQKWNALTRPS